MRTPAKPKAFPCVAKQLHLRINCSSGQTWMLRAVPNHHPSICTHSRDYIWVLRLIPRLVDFALVVDLLHNVELDFHGRPFGAAAVAPDFSAFIVVVIGVRGSGIRKLYVSNLQIILSITRSMRAEQ